MSDSTINPFLIHTHAGPATEVALPTRRRRRVDSPLTPREAHFAAHYVAGMDPVAAMVKAGYLRPQRSDAEALLQAPHVAAEVANQLEALSLTAQVTQQRVIAEHANMAFSDIAEVASAIDPEKTAQEAIESLPRTVTSAIRKLKITRRYEGKGEDRQPVDTVEIEMHDKLRSLDALAKIGDLYAAPDPEEVLSSFGEMLRAAVRARGLDGGSDAS